eukprot:TRINITY_DN69354_c0_g1_i1.p1 TRINITY_DN69354_c0_g1~~TRINITY_DN69354_c0_g1_i1.p1  ORF type:complete len:242 (-),score=35.21 TRINITY_DN69354_c0_g1_i1:225-950(-)
MVVLNRLEWMANRVIVHGRQAGVSVSTYDDRTVLHIALHLATRRRMRQGAVTASMVDISITTLKVKMVLWTVVDRGHEYVCGISTLTLVRRGRTSPQGEVPTQVCHQEKAAVCGETAANDGSSVNGVLVQVFRGIDAPPRFELGTAKPRASDDSLRREAGASGHDAADSTRCVHQPPPQLGTAAKVAAVPFRRHCARFHGGFYFDVFQIVAVISPTAPTADDAAVTSTTVQPTRGLHCGLP